VASRHDVSSNQTPGPAAREEAESRVVAPVQPEFFVPRRTAPAARTAPKQPLYREAVGDEGGGIRLGRGQDAFRHVVEEVHVLGKRGLSPARLMTAPPPTWLSGLRRTASRSKISFWKELMHTRHVAFIPEDGPLPGTAVPADVRRPRMIREVAPR